MKIILHIGMPKAGSSAIQRTLRRNNDLLREHGVFAVYDSDYLYSFVTGEGNEPAPDIPAECRTAIFTDERLYHRVREDAHASQIAEALARYSEDIRVMCYVRREDEVFVSSYFTLLLMGSSVKFEEQPLIPFRTYKRIRVWERAFGRHRIRLRRYGPDYLPDGIVPDFLAQAGLEKLGIIEPDRANVSPRVDVLEIIRQINEIYGGADRLALKSIASVGGKGQKIGLSAEKRRHLVERVSNGTEKLSRIYFRGEPLFTHPIRDDAHLPVELTVDDVIAVGEALAARHGIVPEPPPNDVPASLKWLYELATRCT